MKYTEKAYINANHHTKRFRSHRIASKKMNLLHEAGMDYKDAQKLVIMEGKQKVNKTNSSLDKRAERVFRMYMDAVKQNPEQRIKER